MTTRDLTEHYTTGQGFFQEEFVPQLKARLCGLSGGAWSLSDLDEFVAYAAGSDVDLMSHLIEAIAAREPVILYPGDWFGFSVGSTHGGNIHWRSDASEQLACLCVPSVRNGHLTDKMLAFLDSASVCLLNLNLYPTLATDERCATARVLRPLLDKSILSISFSRGFGMTASQLGVFLVHRDHPFVRRFHEQWSWFTYFYNVLAARTFLRIDLAELQAIDAARREAVSHWLSARGLPTVASGSYYVKSFTLSETPPRKLQPLARDGLVRLCFKPSQC